jgi:hypothetical protein
MRKMDMNDYYVYVYLNQLKEGTWSYRDHIFNYQPFYVGKGRRKRDIMHLCPFMLNQKTIKNSTIKSIINETGEMPIHCRIYSGLTNEEAINIEKDFILMFGRKDNGTGILSNNTDGGDGANNFSEETLKKIGNKCKKVYQYSLEGNFLKEWESLTSTETEFKSSGNISTAIKRNGTYGGYIWSYEKFETLKPKIKWQAPIKYKNIKQIDRKSKKIINTFATALEVETTLKLRSGARNKILDCVNGKLKTYKGYEWKI